MARKWLVPLRSATQWQVVIDAGYQTGIFLHRQCVFVSLFMSPLTLKCNLRTHHSFVEFNLDYVAVFPRLCLMVCKACTMYTNETVDQSNCIQLPRDIMGAPIGSQLLRSKILWMKHMVFWREPDAVTTWEKHNQCEMVLIVRVLTHDWKQGLFPDFNGRYSKVSTFPGPGHPCFKLSTFPGNKDRVGTMPMTS